MKKNLFIVVFSIITGTVCAQYARFGLSAGMEMSKFAVHYDWDNSPNMEPKIGFRIAMEVDIQFSDNFYLVPELVFTQRGTKSTVKRVENIYDDTGTSHGEITKTTQYSDNINALQLPVNAMFLIELDENTKFSIFAGPYVAWQLSGKVKDLSNNSSEKTKFGYKVGEYKPIDLGFNFGLGLEYLDFFVRVQYNHGMSNLLNGEAFNSQRNRNTGISMGFFF
jgi:hypothetical protein